MKKNFKKLVLNKSTLSNLENNEIVGAGTSNLITGCANTCLDSCDLVACSVLKCVVSPKPTRDCPTVDLVACSIYKCEVISRPK